MAGFTAGRETFAVSRSKCLTEQLATVMTRQSVPPNVVDLEFRRIESSIHLETFIHRTWAYYTDRCNPKSNSQQKLPITNQPIERNP